MESDHVGVEERTGLLARIDARRAGIEAYLRERGPASRRLSVITVLSSSAAAALMAGPALGGLSFAETVQAGLGLATSERVWRVLCLGALLISVTAAVSAHLDKVTDLRSHIGAAQAACAMLEGLRTRLEFGRLPVEDAAQEYRDIVAGVPFVPEGLPDPATGTPQEAGGTASTQRSGVRLAVALATVSVLAGALLLTALVGLVRGAGVPAAGAGSAASQGPTSGPAPAPTPAPSTAPVADQGVFGGRTEQGGASLAIVTGAGQAAAYLCDGRQLEAWLEGSVVDGRIDLTGPGGARLTGTVDQGAVSGTVTTASVQTPFVASLAAAPAGVYEARIELNGRPARVGWAVLPDGTQVGIVNTGGSRSGAPALDLDDQTFVLNGTTHRAERYGP
jgi:hypothetical protein